MIVSVAAILSSHDMALVLAATVPAIGAFLLGWLNLRRQVASTHQITQINKAVNHQPSNAPTLISRVLKIEENMLDPQWLQESLATIAKQVGCQLKELPTAQESL